MNNETLEYLQLLNSASDDTGEYKRNLLEIKEHLPNIINKFQNYDELKNNFDQLSQKTNQLALMLEQTNSKVINLSTTQYQAVKQYNEEVLVLQDLKKKLEVKATEIDKLNTIIQVKDQENIDMFNSYTSQIETAQTSLKESQNEYTILLSESQERYATIVDESEEKNIQIKNLKDEIHKTSYACENKIDDLEKQVSELYSQNNIIRQEGLEKNAQLDKKLLEQLEEIKELKENLSMIKAKSEDDVQKLEVLLNDHREEELGLKREIDELNSVIDKENQDIVNQKEENEEYITEYDEEAIGSLKNKICDLSKSNSEYREQLKVKEDTVVNLLKNRTDLENKLCEAATKIKLLEQELLNKEDRKLDELENIIGFYKDKEKELQKNLNLAVHEKSLLDEKHKELIIILQEKEEFFQEQSQELEKSSFSSRSDAEKELAEQAAVIKCLKKEIFKAKLLHGDEDEPEQLFTERNSSEQEHKPPIAPLISKTASYK